MVQMITAEIPRLRNEQIHQQRIGHFQVQDVHEVVAIQPQPVSRDVHDQGKPLAIVLVAEDHIVRKARPQPLRFCLVFLFYVCE